MLRQNEYLQSYMARTTEPRSFPRLAVRLFSAAVCLSLAAAAGNETEEPDSSGSSADSLAAVVNRQVDIVEVYSEWWQDARRRATTHRRLVQTRGSRSN